VNSHVPDLSRGVMPAELLPVSGFILAPSKVPDDHALQDLILRVNAGSLSYLRVPPSLVYRWAALSGRWSADLQTFVAQSLRHTGNLDNFLVQPAALDHHNGAYGLLESSITEAPICRRTLNGKSRFLIRPINWFASSRAQSALRLPTPAGDITSSKAPGIESVTLPEGAPSPSRVKPTVAEMSGRVGLRGRTLRGRGATATE